MPSDTLREQLLDFHAGYSRCIAADELEAWPEMFTAECHYRVTTAENEREGHAAGLIYANSRAMLRDRISALRHANIYERQRYRHLTGSPYLLGSDAGSARCETPFLVLRIVQDDATSLYASGVYRDEFARDGERLLLKSRVVVCDSRRVDTLMAIPL